MDKLQNEPQSLFIMRKLREVLLAARCGKKIEFEVRNLQDFSGSDADDYPFIYFMLKGERPYIEKDLGAVMRLTFDLEVVFVDEAVEVRAEYLRKKIDDAIAANISLDGSCIHCLFESRENSFFDDGKGILTLRYVVDFSLDSMNY